jgi:hypothetical protein
MTTESKAITGKEELLEEVQKAKIQVVKKDNGEVVDVQSGQEAYFALLA